ncbi:hypothetical protein JGU72_20350 [Antrihabitans sp. YC2-6]|nr:hypothetical protein [Antrihabitans sp. YC2-6]
MARRWIRTVTLAETIGFAVPAIVGVSTAASSPAVALPALVAAGAVEGAILGWGQASVLRRTLPGLSKTRWISATAAAAAFAYVLGMAPSTWASGITRWPGVATIATMSILGVAILLSVGTAQWFALRAHVANASRWIPLTAVAWLVGLVAFLGFVMPLWHQGQSMPLTMGIGILGGLLMAATTSTVTGLGLRLVLPR